jgi:hypothetical protein
MSAIHRLAVGRHFAVPCVCAVLAACGGGDGGGATSSSLIFKSAALSGAQENPAVTTAAAGSGVLSIDPDSGAVSGSITTFGIAGNAAHIHEAAPGVNGGVLIPLTQNPPGTWSVPDGAMLTAAQVDSLRNGNLYVNVHTTANPNGEIRGQIGRTIYFATLTGNQEAPANTSTASGAGRFVFDPDTLKFSGTVTTAGIAGTVAHIHTGAIGVSAGVTIPATGGPANWTLPETVLTDAQFQSLTAGNFYFNVHSAALPGGEIRGQVYRPAKTALLTGAQETPPNSSTATGIGWLVANPFTKGVAGRIETTGITAVAAHVHRAAAGVPGGVVIPMTQPSPGIWVTAAGATLSDDLLVAFMAGELYFNVHSAAFPGGEIRGQLVLGQ